MTHLPQPAIPEAAIEAALIAWFDGPWSPDSPEEDMAVREDMCAVLAAALPHLSIPPAPAPIQGDVTEEAARRAHPSVEPATAEPVVWLASDDSATKAAVAAVTAEMEANGTAHDYAAESMAIAAIDAYLSAHSFPERPGNGKELPEPAAWRWKAPRWPDGKWALSDSAGEVDAMRSWAIVEPLYPALPADDRIAEAERERDAADERTAAAVDDYTAAEAKIAEQAAEIERLRERLQAVIDWCDLALANPKEFNSHGVKNLTGPTFDEARAALAEIGSGK